MNNHLSRSRIVAFYLLLAGLLLVACGQEKEVTVPGLVGQTAAAARDELGRLGLKPVENTQAAPGKTAGEVISQDPPPGTLVPLETTVTLTVAAAETKVSVPNVVRLPFDQAMTQLEAVGLQAKRKEKLAATLEFQPEQVVSQSVAAFGPASPGAVVELEIAGSSVAVPDVKGKGLQQATEIMAAAKLLVSVGGNQNDPRQPVAATVPAATTVVLQGTTVTLQLQAAPPPPPAPKMEVNTDRRGLDYTSFDLSAPDPALCLNRCEQDTACRAWTYVKPGVQGPKARCWLKNAVPAPLRDACCVSGVKAGALVRPGVSSKVLSDHIRLKKRLGQ